MTREEYFKTDALSRSALVAFDEHPSLFFQKGYQRDSEALRFGDAFDCLMFDGESVLKERFRFSTIKLPYSQNTNAGKLTTEIIRVVKENPSAIDNSDLIRNCIEAAEINTKSIDKTIDEFNAANGMDHVREMIDPMCLRSDDRVMLDAMRYSLLSSKYSHMFQTYPDGTNHHVDRHLEYFHQQVILFDHPSGHRIKVMLDIICVDHSKRRVYKVDLKTTSSKHPQFTLFDYRYDLQAGLYSMGVEKWAAQNFPGYSCNTGFEFLFCHKSVVATEPIKVIMTQYDVDQIISGRPKKYGQYLKNITEMLYDLKWHIDNDVWDYPKAVIEAGGYYAKLYDV